MVAGTETMNLSRDLLLKSLRAVLFGEKLDASDFAEADWKSIFQLADEQTVSALLLDGMSLLPSECITIPLGDKLKRIATMQRIEQMNRLHRKVIVKIDRALKSEGIPVVFMKGQTTALRYPNPSSYTWFTMCDIRNTLSKVGGNTGTAYPSISAENNSEGNTDANISCIA